MLDIHAGMRPQMYQGGPAPFPGPHPGGMHSGSMPPPGMMGRPSQQMGPPPVRSSACCDKL